MMNNSRCPIEESIAIKADEPEQESALELYQYLVKWDHVMINGNLWLYDDITERINSSEYEVANKDEMIGLYINKIKELMDE